MQSCLEHLGQHRIEFSAKQCCSKIIRTKLNWIFSYAKLFGASRTTLHRVFPVQCCLKSSKATLNMTFSSALLSGASRTKLHRVFTWAMLFRDSRTKLHRSIYLCDIAPRVSSGTTLHSKILMYCCL